eukprot:6909334-Pyramimonas_sp.AAC.1
MTEEIHRLGWARVTDPGAMPSAAFQPARSDGDARVQEPGLRLGANPSRVPQRIIVPHRARQAIMA